LLAEHPNIVGIKESSGNVQRVAEMIAACRRRFRFWLVLQQQLSIASQSVREDAFCSGVRAPWENASPSSKLVARAIT
jgi:dihydrodipicolinate synthase/N-acetylneuraminate lyase